jgi:hypothetical protein
MRSRKTYSELYFMFCLISIPCLGVKIQTWRHYFLNASRIFVVVLPSSAYLFTVGVQSFYFHLITHTTVGTAPLDEGSARHSDLYLTTQTLRKRQTSMPPVRFEPTIPASAWLQTYALDHAATGISPVIYFS